MIIVSPILYAIKFVGGTHFDGTRYREDLANQLWLACVEYGQVCCVAGISQAFKPIREGQFVRIQMTLEKLPGYEPFPINEIPKIGGLADEMMLSLFGCKEYGEELDDALGNHLGLDRDEFNTEEFMPGVLYYKVVPV